MSISTVVNIRQKEKIVLCRRFTVGIHSRKLSLPFPDISPVEARAGIVWQRTFQSVMLILPLGHGSLGVAARHTFQRAIMTARLGLYDAMTIPEHRPCA